MPSISKKYKTPTAFRIKPLVVALTAVTGVMASNAVMALNDDAFTLEEIVVTATKRATGLQDVPIAISVMSGEKIEKLGIGELEELTANMPSVHVAEGGASTNLFVRGIGSGVNFGFEQSVGTFVDGVYYGRGRSARAGFLDLERVEVLKGPQSTLFGKNTIAGAINITTAKPTDELEGYIETSYESELNGIGVTGMISGPITDTLKGRLVAKTYSDDGFVENTFTGDDAPQEKSNVIRGTLVWDPTDDLSLTFKAQYGEFDVKGRQDMITIASPTALGFHQLADPNFTPDFGYKKSEGDLPGRPQFDNTTNSVAQLTVEYQMDGYTLRSITGYTEYDFKNTSDEDKGPLGFIERSRQEDHEQFSQEFLLSSPEGETIEFLTGIYYQTENLANDKITPVAISAIPSLETGLLSVSNDALTANSMPTITSLDSANTAYFRQETETYSAFAEATWNVTDTFRVTGGLRYSEEEKEMVKGQPDGNPELDFVYANVLKFMAPHHFEMERSEDHWTGKINLQYDMNDDTMVYLNLSNGVKGGGFDEDNALGNQDVAEFEEEKVKSIELGAKMEFWDGRARLNMALFKNDFKDVQVSTFDGNASFLVGNAAETTVEGFETDWTIALSEGLTFMGSVAYLDARYESFDGAACNVSQIAATVASGDPRSSCTQDLAGKPLQFAPDWAANLGLDYNTSLSENIDLGLSVNINWSDDVVIANDQDENLTQDAYYKLNARAEISDSEGRWMLALVGKNLNDEKTTSWGNDVPLGSAGFDGTYFQHINPPRTLEVQFRYNFL